MAQKTKDPVIADPAGTAQASEQAQTSLVVDQSAEVSPGAGDPVIADPTGAAQVLEQPQADLAVDRSAEVSLGVADPTVAAADQTPGEAPKGGGDPVERIECAVRMDCIYGRHDDIITLTRDEASAAEAGGYVDTHPNAIAAIRGA